MIICDVVVINAAFGLSSKMIICDVVVIKAASGYPQK